MRVGVAGQVDRADLEPVQAQAEVLDAARAGAGAPVLAVQRALVAQVGADGGVVAAAEHEARVGLRGRRLGELADRRVGGDRVRAGGPRHELDGPVVRRGRGVAQVGLVERAHLEVVRAGLEAVVGAPGRGTLPSPRRPAACRVRRLRRQRVVRVRHVRRVHGSTGTTGSGPGVDPALEHHGGQGGAGVGRAERERRRGAVGRVRRRAVDHRLRRGGVAGSTARERRPRRRRRRGSRRDRCCCRWPGCRRRRRCPRRRCRGRRCGRPRCRRRGARRAAIEMPSAAFSSARLPFDDAGADRVAVRVERGGLDRDPVPPVRCACVAR